MFSTSTSDTGEPAQSDLPTSIRALLLDDSTFDRARIRRLSKRTDLVIHLDEVESIEDMQEAVLKSDYDLLLIDYRLPVGSGITALEHIKTNARNKDAGKIMITGSGAVDTAVQAMRGGCHDFLCKDDLDADMLRNAMVNAVTRARDHQQMQMQKEHQLDVIRQGMLAALQDSELQSNVIALFRQQLDLSRPAPPQFAPGMDPGDIDAFIAGMNEVDEFQFY